MNSVEIERLSRTYDGRYDDSSNDSSQYGDKDAQINWLKCENESLKKEIQDVKASLARLEEAYRLQAEEKAKQTVEHQKQTEMMDQMKILLAQIAGDKKKTSTENEREEKMDTEEVRKRRLEAKISSSSESESDEARSSLKKTRKQKIQPKAKHDAETRDRSPVKKSAIPTATEASTSGTQPLDVPINNVAQREAPKEAKPPTFFLETDKDWKSLHSWMAKNGVDSNSKVTRDGGLQINVKDVLGYRKLQDHFQNKNIKYHSFAMEKSDLRVVIRGLPMSSEVDDISEDLADQGLVINGVHRMYSSRGGREQLPLFLIKVPRGDDRIYRITRCLDLVVRVEKQRARSIPGQCFRCQRYGHSQAHCFMRVRCVRCGEEHRATECQRDRNKSATCALCNKAHPANYKGCEHAPKPKKATPVTSGRSFASVAAKKPQAKPPTRAQDAKPGPSKERQAPPPKQAVRKQPPQPTPKPEQTRTTPSSNRTTPKPMNTSSALPPPQDIMNMFQGMWQQYLDMYASKN